MVVFTVEKETSSHTLWNCREAAKVWKESGIKIPQKVLAQRDFIDILWLMSEYALDIDWELYATTAWGIWKNRNLFKHEGRCKLARSVAREVANFVEEFHQSNDPNDTNHRPRGQFRETWSPPKRGWFKINTDGVVFKDTGQSGIGVVVRNEKGDLMGAMSKKILLLLGAVEVEARVAEEGIIFARDLGLGGIMVEGDASIVISALVNLERSPSSIQKIMEGARTKLKAFKQWKTNHVHRHCNFAAHLLARHACNIDDRGIWVEDTPPMIANQICMDVVSIGLGPD